MTSFSSLGLHPDLLRAVEELGFEKPMPIQAEAIPLLLAEETDLVALAQTGTGKTAAFGLPLLHKLDCDNRQTQALILSPTRELCIQITNDLKSFSRYMPDCSIVAVYGGTSIENQRKELKQGAHIVVATPGRLLDLLQRKYVKLGEVKTVVLDEADEMLDMGFQEDLDAILSNTPEGKQTHLFSATMQAEVAQISRKYMHEPKEITIGTRNSGSDNVKHYYYMTQPRDRYAALKRIVDVEPNIYAILFCRTRAESQDIAESLIRDGYDSAALHGDLSQAQRDYVMKRFRNRNLQMLVATDVAARGIDVSDLTHVINYNLPNEPEQYNHRCGRTGRADKSGIAISLVTPKEVGKIKSIERFIQKTLTRQLIPTGPEICERQLFHIIDEIENMEVDYNEIERYAEVIQQRLEYMDKAELIRRFVSVEFSRFLAYYKNAKDLNTSDSPASKKSREPREKVDIDTSKMVRLHFGIGRKERVAPPRLIGMINDYTRNKDIAIGRIDIFDTHSFVDVDGAHAEDIVSALSDINIRGRELNVYITKEPVGDNSRGRRSSSGERPEREPRGDRKDRGAFKEKRYSKGYSVVENGDSRGGRKKRW